MGSSEASTFAFLCLLLCLFPSSSSGCHHDDRQALLAIDRHLGSPEALSSWRSPQTDCCKWDGVSCYQTNRVLALQLRKISGTIPPAIGDLSELSSLFINYNPDLYGTIPYSITKLKKLTRLILDDNSLSGPIPEFLSQLTTLEEINLSKNKFSGSIPRSFSKLNKLTGIELSNNQLTGQIPDFAGSDYVTLYLSHNKLTGPIPKSLVGLGIMSLDLSYNKLSGDASFLFGSSSPASVINLKRNHLSFDLSAVRFPVSLLELQLDHNDIYGSIPAQINELKSLEKFNVSYNLLCGKIPPGPVTEKFGASSFVNNKCLCGNPLPACK